MAEVYGVITFYSRFTLEPKGKYAISVCLGTACFVKGSEQILNRLKDRLKIDVGQTTRDGKFSIDATRCVGACGLAPVFTVNNEVHGKATVKKLDEVLEKLMKDEKDNPMYKGSMKIKDTFFYQSGIAAISLESMFNGPFLYSNIPSVIWEVLGMLETQEGIPLDSLKTSKIAGLSYPVELEICGNTKFYDYKATDSVCLLYTSPSPRD